MSENQFEAGSGASSSVVVRYQLSEVEVEGVIRNRLIEMGWTPPNTEVTRFHNELKNCKDDYSYLLSLKLKEPGLNDWLKMNLIRIEEVLRKGSIPESPANEQLVAYRAKKEGY